jgi:hypothetical protein
LRRGKPTSAEKSSRPFRKGHVRGIKWQRRRRLPTESVPEHDLCFPAPE